VKPSGVVGKLAAAGGALVVMAVLLAGAAGAGSVSIAGSATAPRPSRAALSSIPADYLMLYQRAAATCPGLAWPVLAGIGSVESDHGRSTASGVSSGANAAGAQGPMQFLPATFAGYDHPVPADPVPTPGVGAAAPSPYRPADAIYAAARYLCASGAAGGQNTARAIFAYNHADWYVRDVLARAATYTAPAPTSPAGTTGSSGKAGASASALPGRAAGLAVDYAQAQLGTPYLWGGGTPAGFDCSGLVQAAYHAAGLELPRTAQQQYDAGPRLPAAAPLEPGDLVFFGSPTSVTHVGIVAADNQMIDAPHTGAVVRVESYHWDDYLGATRPTG
jgi:cell wall-associated NlpC family hydrolase